MISRHPQDDEDSSDSSLDRRQQEECEKLINRLKRITTEYRERVVMRSRAMSQNIDYS